MSDQEVQSEPIPLVLEAFGWGSDLKLRVPPQYTAELRELLTESGVPYSTGAEFSVGPVLDLLVATIDEPAAWTAFGGAIASWLGRNAFRSVKIGDIEVKGHSEKAALRIVEALRAQQERNGGPPPAP